MGLNATLFTAGRSLELFSAGIQVAGQNVANANTPGYVREDLFIATNDPFEKDGLIFGTGAKEAGIRQQLDYNLEQQIHHANADAAGSDARVEGYAQLQLVISELSTGDLSSQLNGFTAAVNELVNQPELTENRQFVVQQGAQLAESIQTMRAQLDRSRQSFTTTIDGLVNEANELVDEVAELNSRIVKTESGGLLKSQAGGLRTQRLTALNRLSEIIPIRTVEQKTGIIDVFSGSDFLVINGNSQHLESTRIPDRGVVINELQFAKTKSTVSTAPG